MRFAISAANILSKMNVKAAEIWSITSFNELAREGTAVDREKFYESNNKQSYVEECFGTSNDNISSF